MPASISGGTSWDASCSVVSSGVIVGTDTWSESDRACNLDHQSQANSPGLALHETQRRETDGTARPHRLLVVVIHVQIIDMLLISIAGLCLKWIMFLIPIEVLWIEGIEATIRPE